MADDLLKRIQILLVANTDKLESGMAKGEKVVGQAAKKMTSGFQGVTTEVKKTQDQVDSFTQTIIKHEVDVRNVAKSYDVAALAVKGLSALAAGVSIGSLTAFATNYVEKAAEIQRFAALIGESTHQLQFYAAGANVAGVSLEKFADINKDALDKLGDAMAGQGEMMDFFDQIAPKIGVTIDQFRELSGPEVIQKYFNGLRQANISHAETVKFMEQIANDGSLLIPMLENGGKGFDEWGRAAERAGAILSDSMLQDINEAKENVAILNLEWQGFQASLINEVIPVLELLKDNSDTVKAASAALGAYVGTQLVFSLGKATLAGYAKSKQLLEQTVVQYAAIQAEKTAAAQDLARAQTQAINTRSTLAQLQVEKALEIQRFKAQITEQGRTASITRMAELKKVESLVTKELTLSEEALTVARTRANAAQQAGMVAGRGLLSVLGGPVGLGLTVAGVAASYMLLRNNTADVSSTLDTQGQSVDELKKKWLQLNAIQRDSLALELQNSIEDLRVKFVVASSDLYSYIGHLEETGRVSETVARQLSDQYKEYSNGRITADQFYESIKAINGVTDSQVVKIRGLITEHQASKLAYEDVKRKRDALTNTTPDAVAAVNSEAEAIRKKNAELLKTKEIQQNANEENLKNQYFLNTVKASGNNQQAVEWAQFMQTFREQNKIGFTQTLTPEQRKIADEQFALQQKVKSVQEGITASARAQTKEIEKQQKILTVNAKVMAAAQKYNFAGLEQMYKIPQGTLSAIMMQESRGNPNAYNKVSKAAGAFQFLPGTAKDFGVSNRYSIEESAQGAAKYISHLLKHWNGDLEKAIRSYHAGPDNVKRGTKIGPVNNEYWENYKARMAYLNGSEGSLAKDFDRALQDETKAVSDAMKEQDRIREMYRNKWEQLEQTHTDNLSNIRNAFAHDKTTQDMLLQRENERHALAIEDWIQYEDRRVKEGIEANEKILRERQETFQAMNVPAGLISEMGMQARAKASMSQSEYSRWNINNEQQDGYSQLGGYLNDSNAAIRANELLTEQERYAQLEQVYRDYLESKNALSQQYAMQEQDLAKAQHQEQLQLWGSLVSQAQNTWGMITQSVKDSAGEQSTAYKVAFMAQQSFSFVSAIISAQLAAAQVAADASITFFGAKVAASKAMLAMGYANAGMIAAQTLSGIAHGGMDYVPAETTYLLDEGERVVSPKQNRDLTAFLNAEKENDTVSGGVHIQQTITFADGSANVDTRGQKQLAQGFQNMMEAHTRKEMRQGGMIYNFVKGVR